MNGMKLTDGARMAMSSLNAAGYECYAVGGCVRDWLLRRPGHDVDLATDAHVEDMHHVFEAVGIEVFDTGAEHGTITALVGQEPIEITTFRIDGAYSDRRHPDSVSFSDDIVEDLARRDFTVNAMAYHPETGLIDPFGGQEDLKHHIIRCVGDPNKRFEEDSLRILRAVRFASQLSFEIDEATTQALNDKRLLLADVSVERIAKELIDFVCGADVRHALLKYIDVIGVVLPEILPMRGLNQHNPYHIYTVLEHTAVATGLIVQQPVLRMTMLLHDCGKPATYFLDENGRGHCFDHPKVGAQIATEIMERLRYSKDFSQRVITLVANHDAGLEATRKNVRRWMHRLGPDVMTCLP